MSAVEQYRAGFEACPFCGAELEPFGPNQANHPSNDCWLSSVGVVRKEFERWNRRTPAKREASTEPMCERKTAMLEADGWKKSGYVLKRPGDAREVGVSDGGAVAWFTRDQWHWLMFNRDHVEFAWPKPLGAAGAGALPDEATTQPLRNPKEFEAGALTDDAKDAARYRFMRSEATGNFIRFVPYGKPIEIDEAIDAAIEASKAGSGK